MMFTYDAYRSMIADLHGSRYEFARFEQADALVAAGRPFVLMRHDIDICLDAARRMAEIEAELGVGATYFFLLRTEQYNLFSADGTAAARDILRLDHSLGLHFDCAAYPEDASVETLAAACRKEAAVLEGLLDAPVRIVSYHRPNALVLSGDPALSAPLPHTYMRLFRESIAYLSDSRGRWTGGAPVASAAFAARKPLHVLIHPIWWDTTPATPEERLLAYRRRRLEALDQSLARNCTVFRAGVASS